MNIPKIGGGLSLNPSQTFTPPAISTHTLTPGTTDSRAKAEKMINSGQFDFSFKPIANVGTAGTSGQGIANNTNLLGQLLDAVDSFIISPREKAEMEMELARINAASAPKQQNPVLLYGMLGLAGLLVFSMVRKGK